MKKLKELIKRINAATLLFAAISYGPSIFDWPTYQGDNDRSGSKPYSEVSRGTVVQKWSSETSSSFLEPIYQDGIVYIAEQSNDKFTVKAYNLNDFSIIWEYSNSGVLNSNIVAYVDYLIIPTNKLIILDSKSGLEQKIISGENLKFSYPVESQYDLLVWKSVGLDSTKLECYSIEDDFELKWQYNYPFITQLDYPIIKSESEITTIYSIGESTRIDQLGVFLNDLDDYQVEKIDTLNVAENFNSSLVFNDGSYFFRTTSNKIGIADFWEVKVSLFKDWERITPLVVWNNDTYFLAQKDSALYLEKIIFSYDDDGIASYSFEENYIGDVLINSEVIPIVIGDEMFFTLEKSVYRLDMEYLTLEPQEIMAGEFEFAGQIFAEGIFLTKTADSKKVVAFEYNPRVVKTNAKTVLDSPYNCSNCNEYLGQVHTHFIEDLKGLPPKTPEDVVKRYKDAGYDFVAMTEHNRLTENPNVAGMLFIEYSEEDTGSNHILSVGINNSIDESKSYQERVNQVIDQGGFASLPHPNSYSYRWSLQDLMRTRNYDAIEIYNTGIDKAGKLYDYYEYLRHGQKLVNDAWSLDKWDQVLSLGKKIYATAGDDYTPWDPGFNNAAVAVFSESLTQAEILKNLKAGNFYAKQGSDAPKMRILTLENEIKVEIDRKEKIKFIGKHGVVLKELEGTNSSYQPTGDEGYVRIQIGGGNGVAWSQPIFVRQEESAEISEVGEKEIIFSSGYLRADTNSNLKITNLDSDEFPDQLPEGGLFSGIFNLQTDGDLIGNALLDLFLPKNTNEKLLDYLSIYTYNSISQEWQKVESVIDKTNGKIRALLSHFSLYTLSVDPEALPRQEISNLNVVDDNLSGQITLTLNNDFGMGIIRAMTDEGEKIFLEKNGYAYTGNYNFNDKSACHDIVANFENWDGEISSAETRVCPRSQTQSHIEVIRESSDNIAGVTPKKFGPINFTEQVKNSQLPSQNTNNYPKDIIPKVSGTAKTLESSDIDGLSYSLYHLGIILAILAVAFVLVKSSCNIHKIRIKNKKNKC